MESTATVDEFAPALVIAFIENRHADIEALLDLAEAPGALMADALALALIVSQAVARDLGHDLTHEELVGWFRKCALGAAAGESPTL